MRKSLIYWGGPPMLSVSCPQSDSKMRAPEEYAGKTAKCGSCGHKFVIDPAPAPAIELASVGPPPRPSAPPPLAADKQWHYAADGVRKGPVSFAEMSSLVASGSVKPRTLVWCEGMDDWKEASQTVLMNSAAPPPLLGQSVPNGMVWVLSVLPLACLPLVFLAIGEARTANAAIENMTFVVILFLFLSTVFFTMDYVRMRRAGHAIPLWVWLLPIPVYLFMRASSLRQPPHYAYAWILGIALWMLSGLPGMFALPIIVIAIVILVVVAWVTGVRGAV
jgi:hypothetical protein